MLGIELRVLRSFFRTRTRWISLKQMAPGGTGSKAQRRTSLNEPGISRITGTSIFLSVPDDDS